MLSPTHGAFDHVAAMDSLIHYPTREIVSVLAALRSQRTTRGSIVFTFAPRTPMLSVMHAVGRLFPAPTARRLSSRWRKTGCARRSRRSRPSPTGASAARQRIASGFYTSQAMELVRR